MQIMIGIVLGALAAAATLAITAWRTRRHLDGGSSAWLGYPATLGIVALGFAAAFVAGDEAAWAFAVSILVTRLGALAVIRRAR